MLDVLCSGNISIRFSIDQKKKIKNRLDFGDGLFRKSECPDFCAPTCIFKIYLFLTYFDPILVQWERTFLTLSCVVEKYFFFFTKTLKCTEVKDWTECESRLRTIKKWSRLNTVTHIGFDEFIC